MINLLYGTSNTAKITSMDHMLSGINISLVNSDTMDLSKIVIDENGNTPIVNAKIKAFAFYRAFGVPVFSCDTGLYFRGVADRYQPGVSVRRIDGKYLDDEEIIACYVHLAKLHGGSIKAYYQNAICLVMSTDQIYCFDGESIHSEEFIITSNPHKNRTAGYPLDSLSIHILSGKFYMDLHADAPNSYVLKRDLSAGFCKFFVDSISADKIL